jgi:hypothetical protein
MPHYTIMMSGRMMVVVALVYVFIGFVLGRVL